MSLLESCVLVAALAGPHTLPATQQGNPADGSVPLSVLSSQVDYEKQTVTFALQNTSNRPVTAWHVDIVLGTAPHVHTGGYGIDAFRQFEKVSDSGSEEASYLLAGATTTATAPLPFTARPSEPVVITPRLAVFADTSFSGDFRFAEAVFEKRANELEAWKDVVRRLQVAQGRRPLDAAALKALVADLSAASYAHADVVRIMARANVLAAIRGVKDGKESPAAALDRLMQDAQRNVAAATVHAKR